MNKMQRDTNPKTTVRRVRKGAKSNDLPSYKQTDIYPAMLVGTGFGSFTFATVNILGRYVLIGVWTFDNFMGGCFLGIVGWALGFLVWFVLMSEGSYMNLYYAMQFEDEASDDTPMATKRQRDLRVEAEDVRYVRNYRNGQRMEDTISSAGEAAGRRLTMGNSQLYLTEDQYFEIRSNIITQRGRFTRDHLFKLTGANRLDMTCLGYREGTKGNLNDHIFNAIYNLFTRLEFIEGGYLTEKAYDFFGISYTRTDGRNPIEAPAQSHVETPAPLDE